MNEESRTWTIWGGLTLGVGDRAGESNGEKGRTTIPEEQQKIKK